MGHADGQSPPARAPPAIHTSPAEIASPPWLATVPVTNRCATSVRTSPASRFHSGRYGHHLSRTATVTYTTVSHATYAASASAPLSTPTTVAPTTAATVIAATNPGKTSLAATRRRPTIAVVPPATAEGRRTTAP